VILANDITKNTELYATQPPKEYEIGTRKIVRIVDRPGWTHRGETPGWQFRVVCSVCGADPKLRPTFREWERAYRVAEYLNELPCGSCKEAGGPPGVADL
jgi:hypothetical protein